MEPRALSASSGLAPWSMAVDLGSMEKYPTALGGSMGLAPLGCLPLWGREGVTLAISSPAQKTRGDFYKAVFSSFITCQFSHAVLLFSGVRNHYVLPDPEDSHMGTIVDNSRLRERTYVFSDRHDAGRQLGEFIQTLPVLRDPVVLAIPAGGVPIGREVARALGVPLSLAIVRKIRIPGTTESGFGAVTWDGQVLINDALRTALGLSCG